MLKIRRKFWDNYLENTNQNVENKTLNKNNCNFLNTYLFETVRKPLNRGDIWL